MHTPVLLQEAIEALQIKVDHKYIDATFGLGGHAQAIADLGGIVLGIDADEASVALRKQEINNPHITLVAGNFSDIKKIAEENNFTPVDGILFDLGLSMWQIRESGRGFTYENDEEQLDMRMSSTLEQTAADIVNSYSEEQLHDIFTEYSEELSARTIAQAIIKSRRINDIETVGALKESIRSVTGSQASIARVFQALRIEVNNELNTLIQSLEDGMKILNTDGRIVIITFHPTEDRIVKKWIRKHGFKTNKKAIKAKAGHSFERSALLRVITH